MTLCHIHLTPFAVLDCMQLPVFVTAVWATRRMALAPWPGFSEGGVAWFPDLTLPAVDLTAQHVQVSLFHLLHQTAIEHSICCCWIWHRNASWKHRRYLQVLHDIDSWCLDSSLHEMLPAQATAVAVSRCGMTALCIVNAQQIAKC